MLGTVDSSARKAPPSVPDWVIVVMEIAAYVITTIPLRIYARARRRLPKTLNKLRGGSLLISNHQSMADPFVILAHLPFLAFLHMLPIRFPTDDERFHHSYLNSRFFPLMTLLGCYSIGKTNQEKMLALFYTRQLLEKGYSVCLFPEGQIAQEKDVQALQKGVEFLKNAARSVIFVRMHGFYEKKNASFLFKKRSITFGEVLSGPLTMNLEEMHAYLNTL